MPMTAGQRLWCPKHETEVIVTRGDEEALICWGEEKIALEEAPKSIPAGRPPLSGAIRVKLGSRYEVERGGEVLCLRSGSCELRVGETPVEDSAERLRGLMDYPMAT